MGEGEKGGDKVRGEDEEGGSSSITSRRWGQHHQDDTLSAIIDTGAARPRQCYSATHKASAPPCCLVGPDLGVSEGCLTVGSPKVLQCHCGTPLDV